MRDILILSIVGAGAIAAIWRPWLGVLLWTWISIMNPHRYAWGIAYNAPVAAIAGGATLLGLLLTKERRSPFLGPPVWWFAAFAVWMTLSWRMGIDPATDYPQWDKVMKIFLMTFVALALLRTKHHIMAFACVTAGSLALIAVKGGIFTILTGGHYRVWGPPGSFIAGNNALALATVVAIPLLHFLQLQVRKAWLRHVFTVVIALCTISALGSQSRGGFLALLAMGAVLWVRSPRKINIAILIGVAALVLLPMMPASWWDRMHTISHYAQDGSAMGRINSWHVAWQTAKHYFFGGGMSYQYSFLFDQYGPYEHIVRAAHSIYFEVLGNHGFVGLFLYLILGVATYRSTAWLRKNAKNQPETKWARDLAAMAEVSLAGFAAGGAFLSLAYFDLPYDIMAMVVLARTWVEHKAWESEQDMPFLESIGFKRRAPLLPGRVGTPNSRLPNSASIGKGNAARSRDARQAER